jgi:4-hydroxy-tetrahydrodipicolinate synthase
VRHFLTVGSSLAGNLLVYNNPQAVQVEIGSDVVAELIEALPNFVGMKDASYNMKYFTEVCQVTSAGRPGFAVFTGTEYLLPSMVLGGSGTFCACAEVAPRLIRDLYAACAGGDYEKARPLQYKVGQLLKVLMANYPATIKYAMELMGRPVGQTRLPLLPPTEEAKAKTRQDLQKLGILEQEPHGW